MKTEVSTTMTAAVAIVGGGPAGLRAATEIARALAATPGLVSRGGIGVLVIERESLAGGIPRHSDHPGYGIRDLGRFLSGPRYAQVLRSMAVRSGATIMTNATVTGWAGERSLLVTTPQGRIRVDAGAVILATGARERSRSARLIPGDRGQGVFTTGHLQNIVHGKHGTVGKRAVIVGAELVSWSAALTLREVKCSTVLMTTEYARPDSYRAFWMPGKLFFRTRIATRTRVTRIIGRPKVQAVEVENLDTGVREIIACDTVILTGEWVPDNELARAAQLDLDGVSRGPMVDASFRTSAPGVFAIGNVVHPVDTADIAALDGKAVTAAVVEFLQGIGAPTHPVRISVTSPLRWVSPGVLRAGDRDPARQRLLLWSDALVPFPLVILSQGGIAVARKRLLWPAAPGRVFRVPSSVLRGIDLSAGDVTIALAPTRG